MCEGADGKINPENILVNSKAGVSNSFSLGATSASQLPSRAEIILGLYKCNYSLTVKELKLHSTL